MVLTDLEVFVLGICKPLKICWGFDPDCHYDFFSFFSSNSGLGLVLSCRFVYLRTMQFTEPPDSHKVTGSARHFRYCSRHLIASDSGSGSKYSQF